MYLAISTCSTIWNFIILRLTLTGLTFQKVTPRSRTGTTQVYHLIVSRIRTCYIPAHRSAYVHLKVSARPHRIRITHLRITKRASGRECVPLLSRRASASFRTEKRSNRCLPGNGQVYTASWGGMRPPLRRVESTRRERSLGESIVRAR